ncbi:protein kinase [Actinocorallia sp. API 0066]|uniref:serine/threonine-protein kinase n=1 Tax=Actinocorallia sp. API 0066 TaxID=2896846 RepID=UPI001E5F9FCA|nr:serine/threonine-protein kinase [Actinocorallia sp. API 0066]MCD0452025.1 protein kinase [Actinocorallia sp. API 0066]
MSALLDGDPGQLGGYWLAGRLGAGGQGVVYEGYDVRGNRVAVKALHAEYVSEGDRSLLRREVEALRRVASFCTAKVIEADLDHVPPFVVSEFVPGPTLQDRVDRDGAYAPEELHRLAIGIATALSAIHQAGVIHRDLKPANVLLGPDGPRVIDFGIAKTQEMSRSATGQLKGTPRWMAPELFRGERATEAADVWAWGTIVLFAAAGRPPFDGESLPSLMHQVLNHQPETDVLTEPLRSLVEASLAHDPTRRPASRQILGRLLGMDAPLEEGERVAADVPAPRAPVPSLTDMAENAYSRLDPVARQAAPRVLLRMVNTRPDARDTVRRVPLRELGEETDGQTLERVLVAFGEAGLIRGDGQSVVLSTPALLRAWPRMRDWVSAEWEGLEVHHALADAARFWDEHGRKDGDLYQGSTLDGALTWAATGRRLLTLNTLERAFLDEAVKLTQRRSRTRTLMMAALSFLLVVALGAATLAAVQSRDLRATNTLVSQQRDTALGTQIAALAVGMRRIDPATAARLAIAAADLDDSGVDVRSALVTLFHQAERDVYQPEGTTGMWNVASDARARRLVYGDGNELKVVDGEKLTVLRTMTFEGEPVSALTISDDGSTAAVVENNGVVRLWNLENGTAAERSFNVSAPGVVLSPKGRYVVGQVQQRSVVWDAQTGQEMVKLPYRLPRLAFSGNETVLVSVDREKNRLDWYDLTKKEKVKAPTLTKGKENITSVAFSEDNKWFALRQGETVTLVDPKEFRPRTYSGAKENPNTTFSNLSFSPDGKYFAFDNTVWTTEGFDNDPLFTYPMQLCGLQRFRADGRSLACVDAFNALNIIDLRAVMDTVKLNPHPVPDADFSADGSTLVIESMNDVQIWDPATRELRRSLPVKPEASNDYHLSDDGSLLAIAYDSGTVDIWDTASGARRTTLTIGHDMDAANPDMAFSPDNKLFAFTMFDQGGGALAQIWDVNLARMTGQNFGTKPEVPGFQNMFTETELVFLDGGGKLAAGNDLGILEVPSARTLVPPANQGPTSIRAYSSGLDLLATFSSDRVEFYDAGSQRLASTLHTGAQGGSGPAAFSRGDGAVLATGDSAGNIRLWAVPQRREFGVPLTGRLRPLASAKNVSGVVFSPDGSSVFSVTDDGGFRAHLIDPAKIKQELCTTYGPLSREDWKRYIPDLPYRDAC